MLLSAAATVSWAVPASAQQEGELRFVRTLRNVGGRDGATVSLVKSEKAGGWEAKLTDRRSGKDLSIAALPEWAGADYYGYDVIVRGFGKVAVVMFEASPAPGVEAPPGAERFQVAWAYGVKSGERNASWQLIATTRNSLLDGGDRLVIRKSNGRDRLVRLRSSEETRFCGADLSAYQSFVPEQMSFRSELDLVALRSDAEKLTARLPDERFEVPPYNRYFLWYSVSSDRYNVDDSRTVNRPLELGDENLSTAWSEGARGLGEGEFATAKIDDALRLRGFRIFPGHGDAAQWELYGKPRRALLSLADGSRFTIDIPDESFENLSSRGGLYVELPRPIRSNCASIVVLTGTKGARVNSSEDAWKQTAIAISEITPVSELYGLSPASAALVVVEQLLKESDQRKARRLVQLTTPLADELVQLLQNVLKNGSEEDRVRVIPLLRSLPSAASVPILVDMFAEVETSERAYTLIKPAIGAHGAVAAPHLVKLMRERPPADTRKLTDLTRLIGRVGDTEAHRELIEDFGLGSDHLRRERVRAVARGGAPMLDPLFAAASLNIDQPKGEDALMAINSIGRKLHHRGQGTHESSGVLLENVGRAERRRIRLLALRGLGYFAADGAVGVLRHICATDKDPLVRTHAVQAAARYPGREARQILEVALQDPSPDVRIAAIDALAHRADRQQAIPAIREYSVRETWKSGLELAFTGLAEIGEPALIDDLAREIARDPGSERAALAADALERAERVISADLVEKALRSPKTDARMKRRLIDLLGLDQTRAGEDMLLELVRVEEPFRSLEARQNYRLRKRALLSLGRRRTPRAKAELLEVVRNHTDTEFRATALRALAFVLDRELVPELRLLQGSAPADLKVAFDQTIEIIERRADIKDVEREIGD